MSHGQYQVHYGGTTPPRSSLAAIVFAVQGITLAEELVEIGETCLTLLLKSYRILI